MLEKDPVLTKIEVQIQETKILSLMKLTHKCKSTNRGNNWNNQAIKGENKQKKEEKR